MQKLVLKWEQRSNPPSYLQTTHVLASVPQLLCAFLHFKQHCESTTSRPSSTQVRYLDVSLFYTILSRLKTVTLPLFAFLCLLVIITGGHGQRLTGQPAGATLCRGMSLPRQEVGTTPEGSGPDRRSSPFCLILTPRARHSRFTKRTSSIANHPPSKNDALLYSISSYEAHSSYTNKLGPTLRVIEQKKGRGNYE